MASSSSAVQWTFFLLFLRPNSYEFVEEKPDRSLLRIKKLLSIKLSIRFSSKHSKSRKSFEAKNQRRNYKKCLLKNSVKSTFEVKLI